MTELAQQIIAENKAKHARGEDARELDLGNCGLTELPDLSGMDWLETLIVSNEWWDMEKQEWIDSQNNGLGNNIAHPPAHPLPNGLRKVIFGGDVLTNWTVSNFDFLKKLKNLQSLYLGYNQINNGDFLKELKSLQSLHLHNNQISNADFLKELKNLQSLDLHNNQISNFDFFKELKNLQSLDLSASQISNADFLKALKNLQSLYLDNNQLSNGDFLKELKSLQTLDLSDNKMSNFNFLKELKNLQSLTLRNNQLSNGDFLKELKSLQALNLSYNKISNGDFLKGLTNLQSLDLRNNQISNGDFLGELVSLTKINISSNSLEDLTSLLYFIRGKKMEVVSNDWFTEEDEINIKGNPLKYPPLEIVEQGSEAIIRYFEEIARLEKQDLPVYIKVREAKVLIVGQGKSGKTSLRLKLENPDASMPAPGDTTRGIKITQLNERMPHSGETLRLNLWDFGGQNVQHFAHQLFLTGNALYILVTNERIQDQVHLPYWLHIIDMLGKKSPIILVQNMDGGHCEPLKNEASIQATFSNVQKPVHRTDISKAKTDANFGYLRNKILETAAALPHIEKDYLRSFQELREKIELYTAEEKHYLKWKDYLDLMPELSEDLMRDYANSLTFLGVCQFFPEDAMLRNYVFLRPKWLIDALFDLILHPSLDGSRGYFSESDTFSIWQGKEYEGMHALLVRMMKEFELCYRVVGEGENYIVPQRLPGENDTYGWDLANNTVVRFEYKFLPKGILTRLICRMNSLIERNDTLGQRVWCDAVIFNIAGGKGRVFAKEVYAQNVIELRAVGEKCAEILNQTIQTLDDIHSDPKTRFENLTVEKMVPCPCNECISGADQGFHEYSAILRRIEKGKHTSECKKSGEDVPIDDIFGKSGVQRPQQHKIRVEGGNFRIMGGNIDWEVIESTPIFIKPMKLFISYSKDDHKFKDTLLKHLSGLRNKIVTWHDRDILPGEDWDERIKSKLREADVVLYLVTHNSLATEYIQQVELPLIEERCATGECILVPVIVDFCVWTELDFAKRNALPEKGVSVTDSKWKNENEAWKKVVEGVQRILALKKT